MIYDSVSLRLRDTSSILKLILFFFSIHLPNFHPNRDNAAWLDGNNKYFEEQELSVQVATMDLTDDCVNYSVKQNGKNRQRLPAMNGTIGQEVRKVGFRNGFLEFEFLSLKL